jgi:hypothetical protein
MTSGKPDMSKYFRLNLFFIALFLLTRIIFALRLPIFNDESIYLQWGMIVGTNPSHWWVSLVQDGKQPGTAILMALTWLIPGNPLATARAISIICALMTLLINISIYKNYFKTNQPIFSSCCIFSVRT